MLKDGISEREIIKTIYDYVPNYVYAESILKQAKAIVDSLKYSGGTSVFINKPYIYSRGNKYDKGNRNIRLLSTDRVLIKYHDGSWIKGLSHKDISELKAILQHRLSGGLC